MSGGRWLRKHFYELYPNSFIKKELRQGPFRLQLTDFNAGNIFVGENWNITGLIDLEWICALPPDMLSVSHWLTGRSIDGINNENYDEFNKVREEFMQILEETEASMVAAALSSSSTSTPSEASGRDSRLSSLMHDTWNSKAVWFRNCISSTNAMHILLPDHVLRPSSLTTDAERILSRFWSVDAEDVVRRKIADRKAYEKELRALFAS